MLSHAWVRLFPAYLHSLPRSDCLTRDKSHDCASPVAPDGLCFRAGEKMLLSLRAQGPAQPTFMPVPQVMTCHLMCNGWNRNAAERTEMPLELVQVWEMLDQQECMARRGPRQLFEMDLFYGANAGRQLHRPGQE